MDCYTNSEIGATAEEVVVNLQSHDLHSNTHAYAYDMEGISYYFPGIGQYWNTSFG